VSPHPYRTRKRFGQHFLRDAAVVEHILDSLDLQPGLTVFEIGPGRGALTVPLLQRLPSLHVIEVDRDLAADLQNRYGTDGRLTVHCTDVLKFDFCGAAQGRLLVLGNLPYNISTPLLFHLLEHLDCIAQMVFMLQKEVAQRLCAEPGGRDYGRLSVMIQSRCAVQFLFDVPPAAFTPPPRVESAVVRLIPAAQSAPVIKDRALFAEIVRTAFSHRRKTLRNALKGIVDETMFENLGINSQIRPEDLPVSAYANLANALAAHRHSHHR
jgi:16S rRNA (adenine1518-N6/adenine1519-N6)-dimethyltransferase